MLMGVAPDRVVEPHEVEFLPRTNQLQANWWNSATNRAGHLILYHDSFATALRPFLNYHFLKLDSFHRYDFDRSIIEREKPTLVISEMLERYLLTTDPHKLIAQEQWETPGSLAR